MMMQQRPTISKAWGLLCTALAICCALFLASTPSTLPISNDDIEELNVRATTLRRVDVERSLLNNHSQRDERIISSELFGGSGSMSRAIGSVSLNTTWGYASERNAARWALIRSSFARRVPRSWLHDEGGGRALHGRGTLSVMDLGADQGYFTLSLMALLSAVAEHQRSSTASPAVVGYAVEKGGFGGAFWREREFSATKRSVHDEIREHFQLEQKLDHEDGAVVGVRRRPEKVLRICPTTITLAFLQEALLPRPPMDTSASLPISHHGCRVSVLLALSMLHWVDGVDGAVGFQKTICLLANAADSLLLELPHPAARRTFGEKRYRGWYGRNARRNVTALLEETLRACPSILQRARKEGPPAGGKEEETPIGCSFDLEVVGRTPWGKGLFREIHRVDRKCPDAAASDYGDACSAPFQCQVVDLHQPQDAEKKQH